MNLSSNSHMIAAPGSLGSSSQLIHSKKPADSSAFFGLAGFPLLPTWSFLSVFLFVLCVVPFQALEAKKLSEGQTIAGTKNTFEMNEDAAMGSGKTQEKDNPGTKIEDGTAVKNESIPNDSSSSTESGPPSVSEEATYGEENSAKEDQGASAADNNTGHEGGSSTGSVPPPQVQGNSSKQSDTSDMTGESPLIEGNAEQPAGAQELTNTTTHHLQFPFLAWVALWSAVLFGFLAFIFGLLAMIAAAKSAKFGPLVRQALNSHASHSATQHDQILETVRTMPRSLAVIMEQSQLEPSSNSSNQVAVPDEEPVIPSRTSPGIEIDPEKTRIALRTLLQIAVVSEPLGGQVYRIRLEEAAAKIGWDLADFRSSMRSANLMFSNSRHEVLRRENFMSIVESRCEENHTSPLVAAFSTDAFRALWEELNM